MLITITLFGYDAKYVLDKEGNSGAALNAVNEECVYAFLDKKINYR